jgi:hypothetical protein
LIDDGGFFERESGKCVLLHIYKGRFAVFILLDFVGGIAGFKFSLALGVVFVDLEGTF